MEKLVSSWYKDNTLPESYVFPPETRPGNLIVPSCKTIPIIDLSNSVVKIEPYKSFCSEVVATYRIEAQKLGLRILELLPEGLGLEPGYFGDKLSESTLLSANHYPPCPERSLTLGMSKHCDTQLLTILHQGDVNGLQVFHDQQWIGVEPSRNALVVNIGNALQIISNDKLKCVEHRVVTNSKVARTSVGFFMPPSDDSINEPAKSLLGEAAVYRASEYKEFRLHFFPNCDNNDLVMERFKLQA